MRFVGRHTVSEKEFSKFKRLHKTVLKNFDIEYYDLDNKKRKIIRINRLTEIYLDTDYNIRFTDTETGATQKFVTGKEYIRLTFDDKSKDKKVTYIFMHKKDRKEHYFIECEIDLIKK